MYPRLIALSVALTVSTAAAAKEKSPTYLPEPTHENGPEFDVQVPMRDGVELHTRVHLPEGPGPFPTVFIRVPYPMDNVLDKVCEGYTVYGYGCAWQSVRGQGTSGGDWVPFVHERDDGMDALNWLNQQTWQNGRIALLGDSYLAAVQWLIADELPPQVKTMIPTVFGTDMYLSAYEGGGFRHEVLTTWMTLMAKRGMRFFSSGRYHRALKHRPRETMDVVATKMEVPWFRDWINSGIDGQGYWATDLPRLAEDIPTKTKVPILSLAGWADAFFATQLSTFDKLATKDQSTMVIGPWNHVSQVASDVKYEVHSDEYKLSDTMRQPALVLAWLDHHLKGEDNDVPIGEVFTYVAGGDRWERRPTWPPPTEADVFTLHTGENPMGCTGELSTGPSDGGEASWIYDPDKPTPSVGGAGLLAGTLPLWGGVKPGFRDQHKLCKKRGDMIGFQTEVLSRPVHVAGAFEATLQFSTDAPDTGVNFRIVERREDGRDIHVREGFVFLSLRDSVREISPYTPGETVPVTLTTWPIEYEFQPGSRIVLEVASASFPKYEAHSNMAGPWAEVTETQSANQTLTFTGSELRIPRVVDLSRAQAPVAPDDTQASP